MIGTVIHVTADAQYGETGVTADDEAVTVWVRDRCQDVTIDLPFGSMGPELALRVCNGLIRVLDGMGYGREIITPTDLARDGGAV